MRAHYSALDTEESIYDSEWLESEFHGGGKDLGMGADTDGTFQALGKKDSPDLFQVIYLLRIW